MLLPESKSILVVDDCPDNRLLLKLFFKTEDYALYECENGQEALNLIQEIVFDLIIMDIQMPVMDGLECTQKIRQSFPFLPILFSTAFEKNEIIKTIYAVGGNDFILKPIQKAELIHRTINLLKMESYRRFSQNQLSLFKMFVPTFLSEKINQPVDPLSAFENDCYCNVTQSVLFIDIQQFNHLYDSLESFEVFNFLNSYFNQLEPIISQFGGFIQQYLGEKILTLFPPVKNVSTDNALHAAISLVDKVKIYNRGRQRAGYKPIKISLGINTGPITLGVTGTKTLKGSSVFGKTIAVAANCEALCEKYQVDIVVSENTLLKLKNPQAFLYRFLGKEALIKNGELTSIYEIYSCNEPAARVAKQASDARLKDLWVLFDKKYPKDIGKIHREIDSIIKDYPEDPFPTIFKRDKLPHLILN